MYFTLNRYQFTSTFVQENTFSLCENTPVKPLSAPHGRRWSLTLTAGYWPASLRSLTFFQRKSHALDVELRSCSLNERRSLSWAEFLLDVIAAPQLAHNNQILFVPQKKWNAVTRESPAVNALPDVPHVTAADGAGVWSTNTQLSTFWGGNIKRFPSGRKPELKRKRNS